MSGLTLDTTGLTCPLPFLKLRRAVRGLQPGSTVEVLSTDPLAPGDFQDFCAANGHRLVSSAADGAVTRTRIVLCAALPQPRVDAGG